jgi:hypothetical protein
MAAVTMVAVLCIACLSAGAVLPPTLWRPQRGRHPSGDRVYTGVPGGVRFHFRRSRVAPNGRSPPGLTADSFLLAESCRGGSRGQAHHPEEVPGVSGRSKPRRRRGQRLPLSTTRLLSQPGALRFSLASRENGGVQFEASSLPDRDDFRALLLLMRPFVLIKKENFFRRAAKTLRRRIDEPHIKSYINRQRQIFSGAR